MRFVLAALLGAVAMTTICAGAFFVGMMLGFAAETAMAVFDITLSSALLIAAFLLMAVVGAFVGIMDQRARQ